MAKRTFSLKTQKELVALYKQQLENTPGYNFQQYGATLESKGFQPTEIAQIQTAVTEAGLSTSGTVVGNVKRDFADLD